jgi:hypothetical protein
MLENLTFYLILVIITVLLVMLAKKIKVAYPVLLVLAGLGISFIPGTPKIHIEPELIFFIFLPPLLYEAAWATSWKELWRWQISWLLHLRSGQQPQGHQTCPESRLVQSRRVYPFCLGVLRAVANFFVPSTLGLKQAYSDKTRATRVF